MKKLIISALNIFSIFLCSAQTDTAFWYAAPDISTIHELPIHLRMTSFLQPCTVTISQPAGGGMPTQTFSMAPNTTLSVDLSAWITSIECLPGNVIQNKGIKITSSNKISVYYEVNANGPNPELFVLKGRNALGNDFYISSQYILDNSLLHTPRPKSAFNIVATEDNTVVTITPTNNIVGHTANIPFVINLNKGQTYAAIAVSEVASLHLQGSRVISTKPIAITLSDDLLQGGPVYGGFCQDLIGDQTVPVNIIGNEYVAIKSNLNAPFDKVYITAIQNATSVMQDGVFITSLNTGQSTELPVTNNSTYIQSSAPVYAYQLSGVGCEMGSTLLPKISCTGSSSVSVTRSTSESFFVTLLVRNGGQNSFLVNNVGGVITAAQFAVVPATGGLWYAAKVSLPLANYPNGSVITVSNSSNIFQLGVLQGGILSGLAHGYFSDYNSLEAQASASATSVCIGSAIELFADFIVSANYSWTGPNGFISNLQNPVIPNAAVVNSGMYYLTVNVPGCGTYLDSVMVTVDDCTIPCNNWLNTPSQNAYVTVGDLDITGNQLTVEAVFNRTAPLNSGLYYGHLISKHSNSSNVNYALLPNGCEITTATGYKSTFQSCPPELNKSYHVAMVYDGANLKYYRNGFLLSQVACTGNMVNNDFQTTIAQVAAAGFPSDNQFLGYANEVRIWNVARTQSQLRTYMDASLPNPTTQPGLQGYYTFDNLLNKQGNAAWNGTLNGGATINNTNPNCTFIADSCAVVPPPPGNSIIINTYTPVFAFNPCDNRLTVEDASTFNVGDTVLLIQMKGAVIDSTNTAAFGNMLDYKNCGNYEFNYVKSKSGNIIELENMLLRQYDIPGKVQLIRVPYYNDLALTDTLTCLPWDGSKGGVLAFNVLNTLTLNADIDVSGKGFRGSLPIPDITSTAFFNQPDYAFPANAVDGSRKGEGIAEVSESLVFCRGPLFSGGGGGNSSNAGGGGGGNGGTGGKGGNEWAGSATVLTNGGMGGKSYTYSIASNKIFMGGAGGAGQANDGTGTAGGNGGGIVLITASIIQPNAKKIIANGSQGVDCLNLSVCADGVGGGGAGGTVLINAVSILGIAQIHTNGGKGADNNINGPNAHGPGGGGGAGTVLINWAPLAPSIIHTANGGAAGRALNHGNTNWGAVAGTSGSLWWGYYVPVSTVPFVKNIDSVRIKDSLLSCNGFDFKGLAYFNTNPIANWQWYFGDGGSANTQNTSYAYTAAGTYTVRLIVTDINGCIDSTSIDVNALPGVNAEAGSDTAICSNGTVSVILNGTAVGGPYLWSPAIYLDDPNIQNPTATISSTTTFYLNVTGAASCTSIDSVTIYINPLPLVNTISDTGICRFSTLVLTTNSNAVSYQWSPAVYVSDPTIANPVYMDTLSHRLYVTGTSAAGCSATDSVDVTVKPLPVVQTIADTTICQSVNITLTTTGAQTYSWSPAAGLSNPNIGNPVFSGTIGQTYTVTGTDLNGCKNTDIVTIVIRTPDSLRSPPSFTICGKQTVELDGNNGTAVSYLWSPDTYLSNPNIINPLANPPQTTLYTLLVTDNACGFDSTFTTLLTILPAPVINARKSNDIDCAFRSATLSASGGDQYTWSPSTGLNSTSIPNPIAKPAATQKYTVQVTNSSGCSNTDSVTVVVGSVASLARYMPNAFTPDGNGYNDCYGLKNWMYIQQLQFYIFNRYGEQVFGTANPNTCWDGTYKGKPALAGTYVYVIKAQTNCGLEEQKGTFLLIR